MSMRSEGENQSSAREKASVEGHRDLTKSIAVRREIDARQVEWLEIGRRSGNSETTGVMHISCSSSGTDVQNWKPHQEVSV
jgi:hypothetical protein